MPILEPKVERITPAQARPAPDRAPDWVARGTPEPLRTELHDVLGADRVLTRALEIVGYASDSSPYRLIPKAVAMPRDTEDVVALLGYARRTRTPLVWPVSSNPSAPIPVCRSHNSNDRVDQSTEAYWRPSTTIKSFPTPCIFVKRRWFGILSSIVGFHMPWVHTLPTGRHCAC